MTRDKILGEIEVIQSRNYNKFKGSNEAELFTREDIADLFEVEINKLKRVFHVDKNPSKGIWVLVHTPYCTHGWTVAKWNGVKWVSSDDCEVHNVKCWQELPETPKEEIWSEFGSQEENFNNQISGS